MKSVKRSLAELVASIEREATSRKPVGINQTEYSAFGQRWLVSYNWAGTPKKLEQLDAAGNNIHL